jgi:Inner membrane protein YgaP-like, transmembrane domain
MKVNMGTADRVIRFLIVVAIAALYFTHRIGGTIAIVLGVIAVVFLVTSMVGFCPGYLPFGISTGKGGPRSGGA